MTAPTELDAPPGRCRSPHRGPSPGRRSRPAPPRRARPCRRRPSPRSGGRRRRRGGRRSPASGQPCGVSPQGSGLPADDVSVVAPVSHARRCAPPVSPRRSGRAGGGAPGRRWASVGWPPMCLLVVASQLVDGEPLIVGANRDEILERPSTSVTVLDVGPPRILGGRDELSGGTWLAVNEHGVCAGLTNQPLGEAKDPSKRSRGELPLALARHTTAPERGRGVAGGVPPGGLQRLVAARGRPQLALLRRLHRGGPRLRRGPPARDPRVGEPPAGRAVAQGRPGARGARESRRRRRGGGRLPPRPGRPSAPRG